MSQLKRAPAAHLGSDSDSASDQEYDNDLANRLAFKVDSGKLGEGNVRSNKSRKLTRNESEKLRRDRLNAYIGELAKIVPMNTNRKMDKSTILRLTVNHLRQYHNLTKNPNFNFKMLWRPDFLTHENLSGMLLESVGGFLFVVSQKGNLVFSTEAITSLLGHNLVDILGLPFFDIIHQDDRDLFRQQLQENTDGSVSGHRSFYVRMLNNTSRQSCKFDTIHVIGHLKKVPCIQVANGVSGEECEGEEVEAEEMCMVGIGRLDYQESPKELMPHMDTDTGQWCTQHNMEGQITFSDPRGAWWTGFMPQESIGLSAYSLLHPDDVQPVTVIHNSFLLRGESPLTVFRMYTKSRDVLYVQTRTHMVLDMWKSKPRMILSVNKPLEEAEGRILLQEQRQNFLAIQESTQKLSLADPGDDDKKSSSQDGRESMSSHSSSKTIIPEMAKIGSHKVAVYVGEQTYEIDLSGTENFNAKVTDANGQKTIFDNVDGKLKEADSLPIRKPKFLGLEEGDEWHSSPAASAAKPGISSTMSCNSSQNLSDMEEWSPNPMSNVTDPWSMDSTSPGRNGRHHSSALSSSAASSPLVSQPPAPVNFPSVVAPQGPAPRPKKGTELLLQELLRRQPSLDIASKEQLQIALSQIAVLPDDDNDDDDTGAINNPHLKLLENISSSSSSSTPIIDTLDSRASVMHMPSSNAAPYVADVRGTGAAGEELELGELNPAMLLAQGFHTPEMKKELMRLIRIQKVREEQERALKETNEQFSCSLLRLKTQHKSTSPPHRQTAAPPAAPKAHNGKNSILAQALQGQHNGTYTQQPATVNLSSSEKLRKLAEMQQQHQQQQVSRTQHAANDDVVQHISWDPATATASSFSVADVGQLASIVPLSESAPVRSAPVSTDSMLQRILLQQQQHMAGDNGVQHHMAGDNGVQQHMAGDNGVQQHMAGDNGVKHHMAGDNGVQHHMAGDNGVQQHMAGDNGVRQQGYINGDHQSVATLYEQLDWATISPQDLESLATVAGLSPTGGGGGRL